MPKLKHPKAGTTIPKLEQSLARERAAHDKKAAAVLAAIPPTSKTWGEGPCPFDRCGECVRLWNDEQNRGGWLSAQCAECEMPVYFNGLAPRNAYIRSKVEA